MTITARCAEHPPPCSCIRYVSCMPVQYFNSLRKMQCHGFRTWNPVPCSMTLHFRSLVAFSHGTPASGFHVYSSTLVFNVSGQLVTKPLPIYNICIPNPVCRLPGRGPVPFTISLHFSSLYTVSASVSPSNFTSRDAMLFIDTYIAIKLSPTDWQKSGRALPVHWHGHDPTHCDSSFASEHAKTMVHHAVM